MKQNDKENSGWVLMLMNLGLCLQIGIEIKTQQTFEINPQYREEDHVNNQGQLK